MSFEAHPVDTLLRAVAGDPSPSYADVLKGRQALAAAIAAETAVPSRSVSRPQRNPWRSGWWRHASSAAIAAAVLIAVVAVTGLLRPEPVTALGGLADIAERRQPVALAAGDYTYTNASEIAPYFVEGADIGLADRGTVFYLVPTERERWQTADGTIVERVTVGQPSFFDDEVAAAYAASGLAIQGRVGETVESEYTGGGSLLDQRAWPEDPEALLTAMRSQFSNEGNPIMEAAGVVELAGSLLKETGAGPELRSAIFQVLDELGLEVVERSNGESVIVGIEYVDTVTTRLELAFDQDANLISERFTWIDGDPSLGVPAGTVIQEVRLSPARTVDSIDSP